MIDFIFPHEPPPGYSYEVKQFRLHVLSIWLCNHDSFVYTDRTPIKTIWGFYNTRKRQYYSPLTSTKQGDPVEIDRTTPYSAMVPKLNPLEMAFYV